MNLKPSDSLSEAQVNKGLGLVIKDGLAAEAMTVLTGGTFLVALALQLGASNLQIGLLAALPTLTNVFQLLAIWLVQRFKNRRAISVVCSLLARIPLLIVGILPLIFSAATSIQVLIFFLFFHYMFGSIAGASWNSWMKDLVPEQKLGAFFSNRSRLTQTLNVLVSLVLALILDYVKGHYPSSELTVYTIMFIGGGLLGLGGVYILSRTPEPVSNLNAENLGALFIRPLKDKNFRRLLVFNSTWSFALNLATPFFTVYMMKTVGLPLSYIIGFGVISQFAGIFSIKIWGRYSDKYSNKTIISIAAPVYIACILGWAFVSLPSLMGIQIAMLILINVLTGVATSGINLAITNIGLKLAPSDSAIAYISVKNMTVAFVSALAPLSGGWLADRMSSFQVNWHSLEISNWNILFLTAGILAIVALRSLRKVSEQGEIAKGLAIVEMKIVFRQKLEQNLNRQSILSVLFAPVNYPIRFTSKVIGIIDRRLTQRNRLKNAAQSKAA
jgi:MFS family permease